MGPNPWAKQIIENEMRRYRLTPHQQYVCWQIMAGKEGQEIADTMGISRKAVQVSLSRAMIKCRVQTRVQLVMTLTGIQIDEEWYRPTG